MSKEIQCKCCKEYWWEENIHSTSGLCPNCCDYVADLEAKLAESESKSYTLESYNNFVNNQCKKLIKENKQLKQQLAEKDNKIKKLNIEAQKYYEDAYCNDFHKQDKISFAVEQIVKTKETLIKFLQDEGFYENEWYDLFDKIDNQIKAIKGEK